MTLTQGLLALAAAVLLVLLAQGLWTSWRARPRRATQPQERMEPSLSGVEPAVAAGPEGAQDSALEPTPVAGVAHDHSVPAAERGVRPAGLRRRAAIDPLIDAIAEIVPEAPLPADSVLQALPASRRVGSKLMLLEGLNAETGLWEPPAHGQRYSAFQAGVQLANRAGPINEIGYSEFVQKVQAFADAVAASVDFADMSEVVGRARELDEFAHAHDAQLAVHLQAKGPYWTVGYLQQCAARQGMVAGPIAGQWVLAGEDPEAPPLVVLSFDAQAALAEDPDQSALRRCTLSLDVPQSPEAAEPFSQWQRLAWALSQDLDGVLVDDDGRPVALQQFAGIHQDLQRLYEALAARDLPAGSPAAQRVFS